MSATGPAGGHAGGAAAPPITVIIHTIQEASNIVGCLESVRWSDDVVIVDSHSTDGTVEKALAAAPQARVFRNPFVDFGQQRNWALDNVAPRHPWVLFLDADER